MENIFSFNMCKKCGKISFFSKNKCPYCNTDMDKLEQKIDLAFISDMEQYIAQIYKQYYEKESYDKKACKNREKMDAKKIKLHNKMVWNENLKTNIKICPKCGDIVTNNYLVVSNSCNRCGKDYEEIRILGFDYYYPSMKGEGYVINKIKKEMNNLGIDRDLVFSNNKEITSSLPKGIFLELIEMPTQILNANKKIKKFCLKYIPLANRYCIAIENDRSESDFLELSYIVNHIQNTLRRQRFIGQEMIVNFLILMFIEVEEHYFNGVY